LSNAGRAAALRDPDKTHFFALAARAMRQILVDYARERHAKKRGGDRRQTTLDDATLSVEAIADEMIALDRALSRLEAVNEWLARLVEWRFFGQRPVGSTRPMRSHRVSRFLPGEESADSTPR